METVELDEAEGRLQLAVVHRQSLEYEESVDQFKQVIELNPGYVDIGKAKKQPRKIEKGR